MTSPLPVAILGAGASGLAAALELVSREENLHLFEAHSLPGGCASWFRRSSPIGSLQFDVGATVLDGLSSGTWLADRLGQWGVELSPFRRMPRIFFKLRRAESAFSLSTRTVDEWLRDLKKAFPEDSRFIDEDLGHLARLAAGLKSLVEARPHFPIQTFGDLRRNLRLLPRVPGVAASLLACGHFDFETWLDARPRSQKLTEWMTMNLLITVQCAPEKIYTPWAALALSFYPLGAGTLPGGMRGLMEPALRALMKNPLARVSLNERVLEISKDGHGFWIRSRRGDATPTQSGPFRAVVSGLTRFDTALIAPESAFVSRESEWENHEGEIWGACTAYVALNDDDAWPADAFNVHSKLAEGPGHEGNDAYLSFSARNDLSRAPEAYRVVTISTHTRVKIWQSLDKTQYQHLKDERGARLLEHLESWSERSRDSFAHVEFGTPRSFERYTHRRAGHVGGLPMTRDNTLLDPAPQRSRLAGLYQIGDTSFPGQSVYACLLGAVAAVEKLESET
ncbi:MAG: FAD-dependent oxidoreductase [Bdellovibrionota bacterium]